MSSYNQEDYYGTAEDEEILTIENCEIRTGFNLYHFIELTGIYGLHKDYEVVEDDFQALLINKTKVAISIRTDLIEEMTRTVFLHKPIITNEYLQARKKIENNQYLKDGKAGENIALKLLKNQVENAIDNGFAKLTLTAYREKKDDINKEEFNGYWLWGRYGFIMDLADSSKFIIEIQQHITSLNIPEKHSITLYQLLSDPEGSKIWFTVGKSWRGTFYLSKGSESYLILKDALARKSL